MAEAWPQGAVFPLHGHWVGDHSKCDQSFDCQRGVEPVDELSCDDCYDIRHDEMDEREACDVHASGADHG